MAAILNEIIPQQGFEIVGLFIGNVLNIELQNQKTLQNLNNNITVFSERIRPVDKTEEIVINVLFDSLNPERANQKDGQNNVNFFIDIYASGKSKGSVKGDELVMKKLLKFVGMCRYILQTHKLITLNLPLGIIGGKSIESIQMFDSDPKQDSNYTRMCRINYTVRVMENQAVWEGEVLRESITQIKLEETNKGYKYEL